MSLAVSPKRHPAPGMKALPIIAYFEEDALSARYFQGVKRFRRLPFPQAAAENPEVECIVLLSREHLVDRYYVQLRVPNVRVLALSGSRFTDPRNDGAVYAYLPADVPEVLLDRMVDNALDHIHLVHTRQQVNQRLAGASQEIHELNQIGVALSAEHDPERLLDLILTKSREFTASDAGSLYLVETMEAHDEGRSLLFTPKGEVESPAASASQNSIRRLRFKLAQNDSVQVAFREVTMDVDERSIAGYVALTGEIVNIANAYDLPADVPYSINRSFDHESGYHTRSILAVPIRNQKDKIIGVLQLINAKRTRNARLDSAEAMEQQVVPFTPHQQEIVLSLASQAAVAYENSQLYDNIHRLFEGFVRASVIAIEARDPTTSGHSFRVANLTVALAEAVQRVETGPYANLRFTREEMREIHYASLLHDFGKVGVREEVLVKAKKLYPAQLELVKQRFDFVKRSIHAEKLQQRLDYVLARGREEYMEKVGRFDDELRQQLEELDHYFETVLKADEPTVLPEGSFEKLAEIAARYYRDFDGSEKPLLAPDEVRLLSIRKGSLDENERLQIESHVVHTVNFLQQIPWTSEIRHIPDIARGHHEKLNGQGYPYKLSAPEIPVQTRMMTISDIFDALSAADRPYKHSVNLEHALEILRLAVDDGELDASLFKVFLDAKVYEKWKTEPHPY